MADPVVREALKREVERLENRGYADNGIQAFKDAAAAFMKRQFGVALDPVTEVNHCIGSKPALAMLPACFINPGDVTLMTVPGYPVAGTHTAYYGGEVYKLPLREENGFYPDLKSIPADVRRRAKLLVINYPNSPTGATATTDFYRQVIDFARTNQVIVVQDAAHGLLTYDGPPTSFLQVDGAKEVGVEVHSLSKGFNMIGWRIGFVAGHAEAGAGVRRRQGQLRFGPVHGDPAGGAKVALEHPEIARPHAREVPPPPAEAGRRARAGRLPGEDAERHLFPLRQGAEGGAGRTFAAAEEVSQFLITEQSVCCVPWDDAGDYLRFSVTYLAKDEAEEDALMRETVERSGGCSCSSDRRPEVSRRLFSSLTRAAPWRRVIPTGLSISVRPCIRGGLDREPVSFFCSPCSLLAASRPPLIRHAPGGPTTWPRPGPGEGESPATGKGPHRRAEGPAEGDGVPDRQHAGWRSRKRSRPASC